MKKIWAGVFLAVLVLAYGMVAGQEKKPRVTMVEGPVYEEIGPILAYKGVAKNVGDTAAESVRVYIYLRRSDGSLITHNYAYLEVLRPGETYPWEIFFADAEETLRHSMDRAKTTYEIKWD